MLNLLYKLSMKFGHLICHQKPERSFFINGYQFPICARCTGITISFIIALFLLKTGFNLNIYIAIFFLLTMFIDWLFQALNIKKTSNCRRLITGLVGGFGMTFVFYYIIISFIVIIK